MPPIPVNKKHLQALATRVRSLREDLGLTQEQLALRMDRDKQSITRLEAGATNPTYIYLKALSNALEMSLSDLLKTL